MIVVLAAPNEPYLKKLLERAADAGVPTACFREPDMADELTGIALVGHDGKLVSSLPLALRQ